MRVQAAGTTFEADVRGSGPDVVLVHAGVADSRMWEPVAGRLPGRRVITYDMRGFGATEPGAGAFGHPADLLALLDALGVERCTLAGASFGGLVALVAAARAPERVAGLVLMAPLSEHDWSPEFEAFAEGEEAALEAGDLDRAVQLNVDLWGHGLDEPGKALLAAMQRRAFELAPQLAGLEEDELEPPAAEELARLRMPIDILVGDADLPDFVAIAHRLADELPGAALEVVPGAGHLLALERPDLVAAALAR